MATTNDLLWNFLKYNLNEQSQEPMKLKLEVEIFAFY